MRVCCEPPVTPGCRRDSLEFPDVGEPTGPLLVVEDLRTAFRTGRGTVRAVDGVSLSVDRGKTLGIVGESGSGKTVLSRSIMGLLPPRDVMTRLGALRRARTDRHAPDQLREIWGAELTMIFQDPMTALNPVERVGNQITESLRVHVHMDRKEAEASAIELLRSVGIPSPERADARLSLPALRRDAPAGHDRHRAGLRPPAGHGRRADHRSRRHRPGPDPRPPGRPAARARTWR